MTTQDGGCFFDFLFRKNAPINNVDTRLTAMIIEAISKNRFEAADFILEQKFSPDLKYVDANNNNLLHMLVLLRTDNSQKALNILIPRYKHIMNNQNQDGHTPFSLCVKHKLHKLANLMETNGATRLCPQDKLIMTDYDMSEIMPSNMNSFPGSFAAIFTKQNIDENMFEPESTVLQQTIDTDAVADDLSDEITKEVFKVFTRPKQQNEYMSTVLAPSVEEPTDTNLYTNTNETNEPKLDPNIKYLLEQLKGQKGGSNIKSVRKIETGDPYEDRTLSENGVITRKQKSKKTNSKKSKKLKKTNSKKSKKILKELLRATTNQKSKFLDEALEKILSLLPNKDTITAKAIRAIVNTRLKETHSTHTSLDRAAEALKLITQSYVNDILKDTKLLNKYKKIISDTSSKSSKS